MIRVLLVDDHESVREGLRTLIDQEPDMTVVADIADGSAAVEQATGTQADVVVLDLTMPSLGGLTIARLLKERTPSAIVVSQQTVKSTDTLTLSLPANGGYAIRFVPIATATTGLTATYYDNSDFTGPTVKRIDPNINFNWGYGSPAPAIASDTFSARWTGVLHPPTTGDYLLSTRSDDGVRLWIGSQLVIDDWTPHALKEDRATFHLVAGQSYSIRVEYFERAGSAAISLSWSATGVPLQVIPQSAFTTA